MSDQPQYLTSDGYRELEERLEYLRSVKRAEVAARLHTAMEEGGELVENAEYEDAKNEQAFVEGEIMRLEIILSSAQIIEPHGKGKKEIISLGDTVSLKEKGQRKTEVFRLVGAAEANPESGRISNESPLGRALLGHKAGETIVVHAPGGDIEFEIKKIQ